MNWILILGIALSATLGFMLGMSISLFLAETWDEAGQELPPHASKQLRMREFCKRLGQSPPNWAKSR